jgi:hypothetical protein
MSDQPPCEFDIRPVGERLVDPPDGIKAGESTDDRTRFA